MVGSGTWKLANSRAEFLQLRPDWERLFVANSRHSPFMSWGWVDTWLRHIAREHELQIISWSDDSGIVQYILPLHRLTGGTGFRSKKIMLVCNYGLECSDNLGCLRAKSLEDASAEMTAEAIQNFYGNRSSISLGFLDGRYEFPRRLQESLSAHGRLTRVRPDAVCPAMDLSADWDEYLGRLSYSFRSQVRRSCRKITGDEPPHHKRVEADQMNAFVLDLIRLNRTRMSSKGNTSSLEDNALREFFEEAIPYMVTHGLAWMDTVEDGGEVLGTALHFVHGDTVYYYMGGFDDSIRKLQPGTGLLGQVIRRAIDSGFTRYDHLRGDESYKYRWGSSDVFTSNVTIYSSGPFRGHVAALLDDLYLYTRNTLKDLRNRLQGRR
jgi:CelD/BcsL family acetyltransferase involved in cellulose biosynthesis